MTRRFPAALLLSTLTAGLFPCAALGAEKGCSAVDVRSDAALRERYPELLGVIRRELQGRADVDSCANVALSAEGEAIQVSVMLPDGRSALRRASGAEDVVPTLQALLLVPEPVLAPAVAVVEARAPSPTAPRSSRPVPVRRRAVSQARSRSAQLDAGVASPVAPAARSLGVELSFVSGARVGDGQTALGAGVLSFLEVSSWLLGFGGRVDRYQPIAVGDAQTALELAILAGRRMHLGDVALDVTAGPAVVMNGITWSRTEMVASDANMPTVVRSASPPPEPTNGPLPRLLFGARLGFTPRAVFRTFVGFDGELGPAWSGGDAPLHEASTRMPVYTVGLALGATVGTR